MIMADQNYQWTVTKSANPLPDAEREAILANPVFGTKFTDHQVIVTWDAENGWHDASVVPYGPIMKDPAAAVLHYGQEIFEGIKAYRHQDGSIWTFRPTANASACRRALTAWRCLSYRKKFLLKACASSLRLMPPGCHSR
jgi:branched-chain amino acid aminotransferase